MQSHLKAKSLANHASETALAVGGDDQKELGQRRSRVAGVACGSVVPASGQQGRLRRCNTEEEKLQKMFLIQNFQKVQIEPRPILVLVRPSMMGSPGRSIY